MKIAILDHIDASNIDRALADNIIYRPDVLKKGARCVLRLLIDNGIDAVVTSQRIPGEYLQIWEAASSPLKYVFYYGEPGMRRDARAKPEVATIRFREADDIFSALKSLEKQFFADIEITKQPRPLKRSNQECLALLQISILVTMAVGW